jgi:hypothetical protein
MCQCLYKFKLVLLIKSSGSLFVMLEQFKIVILLSREMLMQEFPIPAFTINFLQATQSLEIVLQLDYY